MKIIIQRNQHDFGPYSVAAVQQYLSQSSLLPHDLARDAAAPNASFVPLSQFLSRAGVALCKAAILFWLVKRPSQLLIPQTVVFYGMMSGLGFGIYEGVNYQMNLNRTQGIDQAYFLNIARLTSLPFLHAVWSGLVGYFISFAAL